MPDVRWEQYPLVVSNEQAAAWLQLQAHLQLAPNTIDAYGRCLNDYLTFCAQHHFTPETITREQIALYVQDLAHRPNPKGTRIFTLDSGRGLSNSTMQQRLTVARLYQDYLVEHQCRPDNPIGRGQYVPGKAFGGYRARALLPSYRKLPWIPSDAEWLTLLRALKDEPLRSPITQQIRNRLLPLLVQQDFIQQRLTTQIAELSINYRKSPIVAEHHSGRFSRGHLIGGPGAGDRAPEAAPLLRADGTTTRLFEALRGTKHTLLLLADAESDGASCQRLAALADALSAQYSQQITCYLIVAVDKAPSAITPSAPILLDHELALHQRYGAASACLYLIRPDGYIA